MKAFFQTIVTFLALCVVCISDASAAKQATAVSLGEITQEISEQTSYDSSEIKEISKQVFKLIAEKLKRGEAVTIQNFGRFYVQHRDARVGRNPKTGEELQIPAKRYPRFTSSKNLKNSLNE